MKNEELTWNERRLIMRLIRAQKAMLRDDMKSADQDERESIESEMEELDELYEKVQVSAFPKEQRRPNE